MKTANFQIETEIMQALSELPAYLPHEVYDEMLCALDRALVRKGLEGYEVRILQPSSTSPSIYALYGPNGSANLTIVWPEVVVAGSDWTVISDAKPGEVQAAMELAIEYVRGEF